MRICFALMISQSLIEWLSSLQYVHLGPLSDDDDAASSLALEIHSAFNTIALSLARSLSALANIFQAANHFSSSSTPPSSIISLPVVILFLNSAKSKLLPTFARAFALSTFSERIVKGQDSQRITICEVELRSNCQNFFEGLQVVL